MPKVSSLNTVDKVVKKPVQLRRQ